MLITSVWHVITDIGGGCVWCIYNLSCVLTHFIILQNRKLVGEIFPLRRCHVTSDVASGNSDEESLRDPASIEPAEETLKTQKEEDSTSSNEDNPWGKGIVETAYGKHQIAETYRCADDHKCYAINAPPYQVLWFRLWNFESLRGHVDVAKFSEMTNFWYSITDHQFRFLFSFFSSFCCFRPPFPPTPYVPSPTKHLNF